jgi:hypothetical protein
MRNPKREGMFLAIVWELGDRKTNDIGWNPVEGDVAGFEGVFIRAYILSLPFCHEQDTGTD